MQIRDFINNHPLATRHKLRCWIRFLTWQLSQFFNPHDVIVNFVGKTNLLVRKGQAGATGNIYVGLHEFNEMGFLLHLLRKGDLFFDVGANIGSYTILASGHVGARTIAFEPIPASFKKLIKNIEINKLQQLVMAINKGVGSKLGLLNFTQQFDTINHVSSKGTRDNPQEKIEVPVISVDEVSKETGVPLLIKIDVEGYETEVLNGMKICIKEDSLKAIIIEMNGSGARYGFDEKLIHTLFLNHDFLPYTYDPLKRRLAALESYGLENTIYIRDISFIRSRILKAEKVELFSESF